MAPKRRQFLTSAGVVGLAALAGCSNNSQTDETQQEQTTKTNQNKPTVNGSFRTEGYDMSRSSYVPDSGLTKNVTEWWSAQPTGCSRMQPTVADNTVYVGCNKVYSLHAGTGDKQWEFKIADSALPSNPTVVDGTVYAGGDMATFYAIDAETGDQEWKYNTEGEINESAVVANGSVYVPNGERSLLSINTENGRKQWSTKVERNMGNPAITDGDGIIYICSSSGMNAVNQSDGSKRVIIDDVLGEGQPTVSEGTVYLRRGTEVRAINVAMDQEDTLRGETEWVNNYESMSNGTTIGSSEKTSIRDNTLYTNGKSKLFAIDANTGEKNGRLSHRRN